MKKKGFTLVEIIAVVAILAVLGVASFFGIRLVSRNIKVSKLEQIEDKIFNAVNVYVETNEEVKNNLYSSKNGIYVPLNVLKNEGLIDFQDIEITDKDYVITMLGSKDKDGACIDTTTIGSWNDGNKTIYLCTTSSGATNISTVGFAGNNLSLTSKNRVWFYGTPDPDEGIVANIEARFNNYIMYNGNGPYRIYYIDRDDSLALVSYNSFGNVFGSHTQKISSDERDTNCSENDLVFKWVSESLADEDRAKYTTNRYYLGQRTLNTNTSEGEIPMGFQELSRRGLLYNASISGFYSLERAGIDEIHRLINKGLLCYSEKYWGNGFYYRYLTYKDDKHAVKIQLKPCMKISSGNGTKEIPYQITNYCN